jgi:Protein of unknown function (DUF2934)
MGTRKTTTGKTKGRVAAKAKGRVATKIGRAEKPIELPDGMWERISQKAYELWEQRGRQEGDALQNWLDAEEIVMEEIHETRE